MAHEQWRHIVLERPPAAIAYTTRPTRGAKPRIPPRDRQHHSQFLIKKFEEAWQKANSERAVFHADRHGVYVEFQSDPDFDLSIRKLEEFRTRRVRLLNVRTEVSESEDPVTGETVGKVTTFATVFVANDMRNYFLDRLEAFAEKETPTGKPSQWELVQSIGDIRKALRVESFWTDDKALIPKEEPEWCEIWLSSDSKEVVSRFEKLLEEEGIESRKGTISFPERAVKVVRATRIQLERLSARSDDIAEYRLAKTTASFLTEMDNAGQAEWVEDLLSRLYVQPDAQTSVCLLDTGVNNGHPLLAPALADEDCHSVDPAWGVEDHDKHGTLMAGVACYGNLKSCVTGREPVIVQHRLESSKILPPPPNENHPDLWGFITAQGVYLVEISRPERRRALCMPVTAADNRDRGRPTSWSGKIDQLASGSDDDDSKRRLFILSAGNISSLSDAITYPEAQVTDSIHDPGQSWNALTVGAYTEYDQIVSKEYAGYSPVAPREGLSPYSTTSNIWENKWPNKPDIVMEGGNLGRGPGDFPSEIEDLSVLSTYYRPVESHFWPFYMTSAAAAQAAWFAAQLQSGYPNLWPETIRALMVHSANWTDTMKEQFLQGSTGRTDYAKLLRICGYGVPDLNAALFSASNSLTLISEVELQPFDRKEKGSGYRTRDMHLYDLPWPKDALLALDPTTPVSMRVTLSYFIEPGPGEIGWKDRYRYASYGLRFRVKAPTETSGEFLRSINAAAQQESDEDGSSHATSKNWVIGPTGRNRGSIHSDIWEGSAADLAESNVIGIYPVIGWWRERAHLGKWASRTRYSLVVSITTPEETVDLYTPVATELGIAVEVPVGF